MIIFSKMIECITDVKRDHHWTDDEDKIVDTIKFPEFVSIGNSVYSFTKDQ
jgi:hypothetical protein